MKPNFESTIRLTHMLSVAFTLMALLLSSSNHQFLEECPQEVVSQEVELFLVRREAKPADSNERKPADHLPPCYASKWLTPLVDRANLRHVPERAALNGCGSHLRI